MIRETEVAAVTLIGKKHESRGIVCEDSSIAIKKNGVSFVCVSDGAGGKQYTHAKLGSAKITEVLSDFFTENFDTLYAENREAAVKNLIMTKIRIAFADLMKENELSSLEQLSATMLFCAVKDRRMMVGHIGDGLICKVSSSGVSPITMPQNDNAGHTFFVTASRAEDYLRFIKTTTDDIHAVCLMSDGVADSVYDENSGLVKPVMTAMADTLAKGRENAEESLKQIIGDYIVGKSNVSDDASFAVIFFENTKGPDKQSLSQSEEAFPIVSEDKFKALQASMKDDVLRSREILTGSVPSKPVENEKPNDTPETQKGFNYKIYSIFVTILLLIAVIVFCVLKFCI